jgi:two-component system, cell cycle sensor histidine kinase and response regulator CckA
MLGIILGHTDMALEYLDSGQPVHSDLQAIRRATKRSEDLVRQLLAFARKQTIAPKVLVLNDTVEGMLKMLRRLIGENIHLSWMPGKNLWPVNMDPTQIDQILANLCVNARDAIDGVGRVAIETDNVTLDEGDCTRYPEAVPGDYVLLAVSDDGCGIDKEILDKLFEPFFTTKEVGKGTGLGLPMIYGIVKQNNGIVNVYSEPGEGTTFKIYIPRHIGEDKREQKQSAGLSLVGGHETVLLVEDEPILLQMGKAMLERLGYRVLDANSPAEAVKIAEEHKNDIHLLITDVIMPEMNGRDLADKLLSLHPHLKLLFMSGYTADVIAHHGVLDPGVKFVQKPFSMKDLANRIREALES